jgi:cytochrome c oxidase assembly factor CtaG
VLVWIGAAAALFIALGSPVATLHHELLSAHMAQHILLSLIGAPLIVFGARPRRSLAHPAVCWAVGVGVFMAWHIPAFFELGSRTHGWHAVEQVTFFISGLMFWQPLVVSISKREFAWWVPLYLFLAMLPCDAVSAFLAFSDRVAYPMYSSAPGRFGLSALQDQACAGAVMWFAVTIAYAAPAAFCTIGRLSAIDAVISNHHSGGDDASPIQRDA